MLMCMSLLATQSGCSKGEKAEREFEIATENGSSEVRCREATKVANAYLSDENKEKYQDWRLRADINCLNAETEQRLGITR